MKIYTKKGDSGETSLFGGTRVPKSNERIEAYGTVDELNSFVGLAASYDLSDQGQEYLRKVQELLFILGADLATPPLLSNANRPYFCSRCHLFRRRDRYARRGAGTA